MSLNRATLVGHLGQDPEIRSTERGTRVATFSLATSKRWKDKQTGEKRERTEWHRIVVWNEGLVDVVDRYLKKGMQVLVEGKIATRKWQDQAGQDRYTTEIVLQGLDARLLMLGKSGGNGVKPAQDPDDYGSGDSTSTRPSFERDFDDDIPF